jgi:hypothetical protein
MDPFGYNHVIESSSAMFVAQWFEEWLPQLVSPGWYLTVETTTEKEVERIPTRLITSEQLRAVIKSLRKGSKKKMSDAGWCDFRNHPYKRPDDPDEVNTITRKGETKELCDECAAEIGLIDNYEAPESPAERKAIITNGH